MHTLIYVEFVNTISNIISWYDFDNFQNLISDIMVVNEAMQVYGDTTHVKRFEKHTPST